MPADVNPAMTARFTIRAGGDTSRLATTRAPGLSTEPSAAPIRAANSGVISTFARPAMP